MYSSAYIYNIPEIKQIIHSYLPTEEETYSVLDTIDMLILSLML